MWVEVGELVQVLVLLLLKFCQGKHTNLLLVLLLQMLFLVSFFTSVFTFLSFGLFMKLCFMFGSSWAYDCKIWGNGFVRLGSLFCLVAIQNSYSDKLTNQASFSQSMMLVVTSIKFFLVCFLLSSFN